MNILLNIEIKKKTDLEKRKPLAIENSTDRYGVLENQNRIKIIGMSSFIPAQLSYASWAYILRMSVTEKKNIQEWFKPIQRIHEHINFHQVSFPWILVEWCLKQWKDYKE